VTAWTVTTKGNLRCRAHFRREGAAAGIPGALPIASELIRAAVVALDLPAVRAAFHLVLQGWPELGEWTKRGTSPLSAAWTKATAYRVVGNAVPPSLAEAVGRAVIEADATWRRVAG
jgi:hypothetical protein